MSSLIDIKLVDPSDAYPITSDDSLSIAFLLTNPRQFPEPSRFFFFSGKEAISGLSSEIQRITTISPFPT